MQAGSQWVEEGSSAENYLFLVNWTNVNAEVEYKGFLGNAVPLLEMAVQQSRAKLHPHRCAPDRSPVQQICLSKANRIAFRPCLSLCVG